FGFEPAEDYEYLVKEGRGRRVFAAAPAHSLILLKATGAVPHVGGKRLDPKSAPYELLHRWLAQGSRPPPKTAPALDRIEVQPASSVVQRGGKEQLTVVAHFRDGSSRDVTPLAQLEVGPVELLTVDGAGAAIAKQRSGSATVTARYQDAVAV